METKESGYRPDVDGLRAIAVAFVVAYHVFPRMAPGGFVGVDVFFVISGYLITGIVVKELRTDRFSFLNFYLRRIRRLFPALAVVFLSSLIVGWFCLTADEYRRLAQEMVWSSVFAANLFFLKHTSYFDVGADLHPLLHLWSLGIEEQYYVFFPALLVLLRRVSIPILPIILLLFFVSVTLCIGFTGTHPAATYFLPATRMWELLAGALLVLIARGRTGARLQIPARLAYKLPSVDWQALAAHALSTFGIVLILVSGVWLNASMPYPGWRALLPVVGTVLAIYAGPDAWANRAVLAWPPLVALGLWSYPLYLWHWPVLYLVRVTHYGAVPVFAGCVAIFISIALSFLVYQLIELPVRRLARSPRFGGAINLGLPTAIGVLAVMSGAVFLHNGFVTRFPDSVRYLASYPYEYDRKFQGGAAFRFRTCFLDRNQSAKAFSSQCIDEGFGQPGKTSVLLWGDSHAASLYSGLRRTLSAADSFALAQFTSASCAPILGLGSGHSHGYCAEKNRAVTDDVVKLKPDVVVLAARWGKYDVEKLRATILLLQADRVPKVVVVGPLPEWPIGLPATLYRINNAIGSIPARSWTGLLPEVFETDKELDAVVSQTGAQYFSTLRDLCDSNGCLVRTGSLPTDLVAFDYGHLTPAGSYFVSQALVQLIDNGSRDSIGGPSLAALPADASRTKKR